MTQNALDFSQAVSMRFICDSMLQWAIATEVNDVWLLDHIMADDLVWFDDDGKQRNKQDALAEIVEARYVGSLRIDYLAVGFDGDTAYCAASESWNSGGGAGRLLAVTTWKFRARRWFLVRSEDAPVETLLRDPSRPEAHLAMLRSEVALWKQSGLARGIEVMQKIEAEDSTIKPAFGTHGYDIAGKDDKLTRFVVNRDF